jgi:hypothetical protein
MSNPGKTILKFDGRSVAAALTIDITHVVRRFKILFDPYRPELHYMRGAGPKWRAKHDRPLASINSQFLSSAIFASDQSRLSAILRDSG